MKKINYFYNYEKKGGIEIYLLDFMPNEVILRVREFHKKIPNYTPTPLYSLNHLAKRLGINKILVKDESQRFGLNAFKVLGSSYAIGYYLSQKTGINIMDLSFDKLKSTKLKEKIGNLIFVTATDGNHGRGVAWVAREIEQKAVVFMPKGTSLFRVNNIKKEGAEVIVTDVNYDATVQIAAEFSKKQNAILIQDTAWEGYEEIPTWIMQGYSTIIDEVIVQLNLKKETLPTHIFLQAGVGSFAAGIQGYITSIYGIERPATIIIEPIKAACLFKSIKSDDGKPRSIKGKLSTIMAGLACGKPNIIALKILRDYADMFIACPDYISAKGMRILGNPLSNDPKIISGESGAVGMGLLATILQDNRYEDIKVKLNITENSIILIISTEGDTDPEDYRRIVWEGYYPSL